MEEEELPPNLPDDKIAEIISQLPAKIVGRCRCFSTSLRTRLSEPIFIRAHLEHSKRLRQESLILNSYFGQGALYSVSLHETLQLFNVIPIPGNRISFPDHGDSWHTVYGSCDGLVMAMDSESRNVLLNPITKEIREVPPLPKYPDFKYHMFGMGYDSGKQDYKIVALSCHENYFPKVKNHNAGDMMFAYVWFLKSGASWRRVECQPNRYYVGGRIGQFVNGHIHWLANRIPDTKTVILAFNLEREEFHEVGLPDTFNAGKNFNWAYHGVCNGRLCIFNQYKLWLMRDYDTGVWTQIPIHAPGYQAISVLNREQLLMRSFWSVAIYDLELETLQDVAVHGDLPEGAYIVDTFVESLVSPH